MPLEHRLLSQDPSLLPIIADWYFQQWGSHAPGRSVFDERQRLEVFLHEAALPLLLIALDGDQPVAAAQLKFHERTERPERQHWLGGVYVHQAHRGAGLAARLIEDLMVRAADLGVRDVYLQTEADDGGLYRRLGWTPLESVRHATGIPVRIMLRRLSPR
ncbi:GNAT family N-acetyltransferase [Bacillus subtilis subsp. subtilis]|nr:GNAT family N-acetyltransferase [Bacillus subtilis subsp. subtilis]